MSIGKRITKLRKDNHLSQEMLAGILNVSRQSISKWEQDIVTPDMDNIINLCQALDASIEYVVQGKITHKGTKSHLKDYIVLAIGMIFAVMIVVILIIDPKILLETSSVLYFNGLALLIIIALTLITVGIFIAYKSRKNEKKIMFMS